MFRAAECFWPPFFLIIDGIDIVSAIRKEETFGYMYVGDLERKEKWEKK